MDTRTLELFLHLSNSLHFGQTSSALHISPSALTRTIKQLEEKLETRLFKRDNRTVTLTKEGRLFQEYALRSLTQWQDLKNDLMEEQKALQGEISIYCSVTASYSFLHNTLSEFRNAHPKISIILHTGDPENAIDHIRQGSEDIAISSKPEHYPKNLAFKRLSSSPLVIIGSHEQSSKTPDWHTVPMILPERGLIRDKVNQWLKQNQVRPTIYAQVSGNEAIVSMVSLGFGYGFIPKIVLENSPLASKVNIISHEPELPTIDVGFFAQKKNLQNPLIQAAWNALTT